MDTYNKFSCFLIGEGSLPIQCAQILLDREHTIYGMISSDIAVHDWARARGIPHIDPKNKDMVTFLSQHPFDYLFSIVNMSILPQRVLELPRRCAINFHDAPLPRYAGRYPTSWAILQRERVHGVTWHAVGESEEQQVRRLHWLHFRRQHQARAQHFQVLRRARQAPAVSVDPAAPLRLLGVPARSRRALGATASPLVPLEPSF